MLMSNDKGTSHIQILRPYVQRIGYEPSIISLQTCYSGTRDEIDRSHHKTSRGNTHINTALIRLS